MFINLMSNINVLIRKSKLKIINMDSCGASHTMLPISDVISNMFAIR